MSFFLSAPSDPNSYSATVDGSTKKIVRTSAGNGAVQFAALWKEERFDYYYKGWKNFQEHGRRRWFAVSEEYIEFDGCVNYGGFSLHPWLTIFFFLLLCSILFPASFFSFFDSLKSALDKIL